MTAQRRIQFVYWQTAWMLITILALTALGTLTPEGFLFLSLLGFLVVSEWTAPNHAEPAWRVRAKWVLLLGLTVFGVLVLYRVAQIAQSVLAGL